MSLLRVPLGFAVAFLALLAVSDAAIIKPVADGESLVERHAALSRLPHAAGFVVKREDYELERRAMPEPDKKERLVITSADISPDGFTRRGIRVNGEYPAKTFVWDEDDDIEIEVINDSDIAFSLHWHGLHQYGTPEMDGVPGVSQWSIYGGDTFVYRFKLTGQHGSYWWHNHGHFGYESGLRGHIYIRPKPGTPKPWARLTDSEDEQQQLEDAERHFQTLVATDQWHVNHNEVLETVQKSGTPPACFDSLLINGKGRVYCPNDYAAVAGPATLGLLSNFSAVNPEGFTSKGCISLVPPKPGYETKSTLDTYYGGPCKNTTHPLEVFNAGKALQAGRKWLNVQISNEATNWYYGLSIDGHKMWIVAVDGIYIEPLKVDFLQITIGSRLSVMIELNREKAYRDWPIRLTSTRPLQPIEANAMLSYDAEAPDSMDLSLDEGFHVLLENRTDTPITFGGVVRPGTKQWVQKDSVPYLPSKNVPRHANMTLHAVTSQNSLNVWQIASQPMDTVVLEDTKPALFKAVDSVPQNKDLNPYATVPWGTVMDIIVRNNVYSIVGGPNSPHPMHLHSRQFWIIGEGKGDFPYDSVAEAERDGLQFRYDNPPLRDGFDIGPNSWTVIRYRVDHAAANILHCHIDDHLIEGMAAVLLEGVETLPRGHFGKAYTERPENWHETSHQPAAAGVEKSLQSGLAANKYPAPVPTESAQAFVDTWGDPRPLAQSIEAIASASAAAKAAATPSPTPTSTQQRRGDHRLVKRRQMGFRPSSTS
ncbi:related to Laccase I precursor [Pseudozyma flocculosa]|nr:related to Laccase I precursor [Pseudozyma flocculosa]